MNTCQQLQDYVNQGILARDTRGRYVFKNGTYIRRGTNETIVSAVKRTLAPQSNFIPIHSQNIPAPARNVYAAQQWI